ncbi:phosphatidate cytidylyltransferase [Pseudidiomarina indica]|uniref:Phosphatidate cytidylyltransferase n=1 Tax=Pseudidiomarina indica TaxID=1159017 RepID=A0A1G6AEH5_9GAMM|nr:phosphatidate cytidylyltransferase [Pseudidiomarina indica]SDB06772.1 phosphatidate cytidylyltransferase [Pseudidiomarina indica]
MLKQRLITALVLIPLALYAVFMLPIEWFAVAVVALMAAGAWEWAPFMGVTQTAKRWGYVILVVAILSGCLIAVPLDEIWQNGELHPVLKGMITLGCGWWLLATLLVINYPRSRRLWLRARFLVGLFGLLTLVPAWAGLMAIRSIHYAEQSSYGGFVVLFVLLLVWAADVGAYFAGVRYGRKKLMPAVSPGKTIEGLIGGLALAGVVLMVLFQWVKIPAEQFNGYYMTGLFTVIASVFGDLNESMFKRCAGIKDSGNILPGHGGILDRIDSLTAALPVFTLCYLWLLA